MDPRQTRGFLNGNPGNMDRGEPLWNGEIHDRRIVHALVNGIICVECAGMPYDGDEIERGLELAGGTS